MHRRSLLAALGSGAAAAGSGCLAPLRSGIRQSAVEWPRSRADTGATGCPAADATHVYCTTDGDPPADAPAVIDPARTVGHLPEAHLSFTLRNRRRETLGTSFSCWRLHKWTDGRWTYVAPVSCFLTAARVPPGGEHAWRVTASNLDIPDLVRTVGGESMTVHALGPGTYSFGVSGEYERPRNLAFAARFRLRGPPLELRPTSAVEGVERDDETLVVHADPESETGAEPATLTVERVPEEAGARRVLVETAYRDRHLRDTLAFANAADRIRLETRTPADPPFGVHGSELVRFQGATYRLAGARG